MEDARQYAPATERNREPILAVLRRVLPAHGLALEIASGTGEHAVHFARALPGLTWQPSDPNSTAIASISAWAEEAGLPNLRPPLILDASAETWPIARADAIVCINMIHISPWLATLGLMRGAGRALGPGGVLYLYGPYKRDGQHTAPSNAAFDESLRRQNPEWGVRDLERVIEVADAQGLRHQETVAMPANNLSVVFVRA